MSEPKKKSIGILGRIAAMMSGPEARRALIAAIDNPVKNRATYPALGTGPNPEAKRSGRRASGRMVPLRQFNGAYVNRSAYGRRERQETGITARQQHRRHVGAKSVHDKIDARKLRQAGRTPCSQGGIVRYPVAQFPRPLHFKLRRWLASWEDTMNEKQAVR